MSLHHSTTCKGHLQLEQGDSSIHSWGENLATIQIVNETIT